MAIERADPDARALRDVLERCGRAVLGELGVCGLEEERETPVFYVALRTVTRRFRRELPVTR